LDDFLFNRQFSENILLNVRRNIAGGLGPLVLDREVQRVFSELFQKHEKSPSADPEDLLDIGSFDFLLEVALKKLSDLIWGKALMKLRHSLNPPMVF
jgi:hypothetical protein